MNTRFPSQLERARSRDASDFFRSDERHHFAWSKRQDQTVSYRFAKGWHFASSRAVVMCARKQAVGELRAASSFYTTAAKIVARLRRS